MELQSTIRFTHYEDEELAALAEQTLKQLVNQTETMITVLSAFNHALTKAAGSKIKGDRREELEKTLASVLDN